MQIEAKGANNGTGEDIDQLEQVIGTSIPEQYREWLSNSGGGWVEELVIPETDGNGLLYEFLSPKEIESQRANTGGFVAFVPARYLVIGVGAGGSLAIGLSNDTRGAFYWADYDVAVELDLQDSASEEIMTKIATDWADLLVTLDLQI